MQPHHFLSPIPPLPCTSPALKSGISITENDGPNFDPKPWLRTMTNEQESERLKSPSLFPHQCSGFHSPVDLPGLRALPWQELEEKAAANLTDTSSPTWRVWQSHQCHSRRLIIEGQGTEGKKNGEEKGERTKGKRRRKERR